MKKYSLIILPGWGGSRETWADFAKIAKAYFEVHVIDLPCFGSAPCPSKIWGVEDYGRFVQTQILQAKHTESNIILLGHSFGGQIAAAVVANNPALVDVLVLTGAAIYRKKRPIKNFFFGVVTKIGTLVFSFPFLAPVRNTATKILYRIAHSDYAKTSGIQREIYKKITRQDVSHVLPQIAVPTLVIWGKRDRQIPILFGKKIAKNIKNAEFVAIKKGTHGLHHQTKQELLGIIINFVHSRI